MLDTNVIFSAIVYRSLFMAKVVEHIKKNHTIVLCERILYEMEQIVIKKFPNKLNDYYVDVEFLTDELFTNFQFDARMYPPIKDHKDLPILVAAIESQVDLLITGDTDFDEIQLDKPLILKPRQYYDKYMIGS